MSYSKSIFFIPVWFDHFEPFTQELAKNNLWESAAPETFSPRYLLNYAARIANNKKLFQLFELKETASLNVYMFEEEINFKTKPELERVRFSCFSTGVGFLEFCVKYKDMTPEEISDFSYMFKKATKACEKNLPNQKRPLYDVAVDLLPQNVEAELFFTAMESFKYECFCFHFLHLDEKPESQEQANERLYLLSRSYSTKFTLSAESNYDMIYKPSMNDHWGGSVEGLVNITYDFENDDSDYYLHNIKISHLSIDYYFLYLLLLNQRFTAIQYIHKVAMAFEETQQEIERLNKRIVALKTVFSFNVISDDRIFQNVYSKMYSILEIEHLLADIIDNESQMEILQNASSVKAEKLSSKFLFGISILSLFSALIDASSYFDRISHLRPISTVLGFLCVCATVALCIIWLLRERK